MNLLFSSLSTVKYKSWLHTLSTHTSHSFHQVSESAPIKGFCRKKLLCEGYHHSPLMPLPMTYWAVYAGNRHHSGSTDTDNGLSISVSDCLLSNQETSNSLSLYCFTPIRNKHVLISHRIKSQKKSSWICSLFYFIPISPSFYKIAWKNYFYAHRCQFLSSTLGWILLGQVISWLDYHDNICNSFFFVSLFSSSPLILFILLFYLLTVSYYETQAGLELTVHLIQPSNCFHFQHMFSSVPSCSPLYYYH